MTFGETYRELLDLADSSDISSSQYAKNAVNRAITWTLNQLDFALNETSADIAYTTETQAIPSDCLHFVSVTIGDQPLKLISEAQFTERRRVYYEKMQYPLANDYESTFTDGEQPLFVVGGGTYRLVPFPPAGVTLTALYQKKFTPLTADSGTHFLLDNASDMIILRCLCASSFRARVSPAVAAAFPLELFNLEWDNVVKWNSSLRSNQFKIG